ncbi:MAG: (2Fe-2S) ferredoxin domain-containing protein, partial [Cyanobacteria bacterium J06639_1]
MDLSELEVIAQRDRQHHRKTAIRCCTVGGCASANAAAVKERLEEAVTEAGLGSSVEVCGVGCMGLCSRGSLVQVQPQGTLYDRVEPERAAAIVNGLQDPSATLAVEPSPYQPKAHP